MKRLAVLLLLVGVMLFTVVPIASAHVHGFTPLGCLTTDSPNAGASVGFVMADRPRLRYRGLLALIPLNASGRRPSGGQGAENACKWPELGDDCKVRLAIGGFSCLLVAQPDDHGVTTSWDLT